MKNQYARGVTAVLLSAALATTLSGCMGATSKSVEAEVQASESTSPTVVTEASESTTQDAVVSEANLSTTGVIDTTDLFTERDLTQTADLSDATRLALTSGEDVPITSEGVYVLSGEASDVTVTVDVDSTEKVQIVLDGLSITNADAPAIYVVSADKVFVTTTEGSSNTLTVTGAFVADGDTNTDAVIFSKDDLVLNGLGTLTISSTDNGISCKDDLKVTGGTYAIDAVGDGLEANDSISISDGSFAISSQADALHAENDEDDTVGSVYICGGSFDIDAASDGIRATTYLQVDGGSFDITAGEALESTYVQVNGGEIQIAASDDGINATTKSSSIGTPTVEITGGAISITMASGDTDAIDSNGNLYISGGTVDINAQFAFDFDGAGELTGGTVTVNGEQVSSLANSMMGGGMGMRGDMAMGGAPEGEMGGQMGGGPRG